MKKLILFFAFTLTISNIVLAQKTIQSSDGISVQVTNPQKVITIGGSITETVYALGKGELVIATDASSSYPSEIFRLPKVPYVRNLTAEGILSLGADLIISSNDANPKSAIDQIRSAGTNMILVEEKESLKGVIQKITTIGNILNAEKNAEQIVKKIQADYKKASEYRTQISEKPKVLFVLAVRGTGSFMVAGNETGAEVMIELAGGINAIPSFSGYKQTNMESILAANPDYILVMEGRNHAVKESFENTPGFDTINAVKNNNIITIDGNYLLGFGPRFGAAILDLMKELHPELNI